MELQLPEDFPKIDPTHPSTSEHRKAVLDWVCNRTRLGAGITKEELQQTGNFPVSGGDSIKEYIELDLGLGNIEWVNNTLTWANRPLPVELPREQMGALRDQARQDGISVEALAQRLVIDALTPTQETATP